MKVSVLQENLKSALAEAKRFAPSKPSLGVLENVKLATDAGRLSVTVTDLEIAYQKLVGAKVEIDGAVLVNFKALHTLVSKLPAHRIDLGLTDDGKLLVQCGTFKATMPAVDAAEFPSTPSIPAYHFDIGAQDLKRVVGQVSVSLCADDNRPVLMYINTRFDADGLQVATADGYRLSRVRHNDLSAEAVPATVNILGKPVVTFAKAIGKKDNNIATIHYDAGAPHVAIEMNNATLWVSTSELTFPDLEAIIPAKFETRLDVSAANLASILRSVAPFAAEVNNHVKLTLQDGTLTVSTTAPDVGAVENSVEGAGDGALSTGLDVNYLLGGLDAVVGDTVTLNYNSPTAPFVLTDANDPGYFFLLMPMHRRDD